MKDKMKELGWNLEKLVGDMEFYSTNLFTFEKDGYEMFATYSHIEGMIDIYYAYPDGHVTDYFPHRRATPEEFLKLIKGLSNVK